MTEPQTPPSPENMRELAERLWHKLSRNVGGNDAWLPSEPSITQIIETLLKAKDMWKREAKAIPSQKAFETMLEALKTASQLSDDLPELNTGNYHHDDVVSLNNGSVELCLFLREALALAATELQATQSDEASNVKG